MMNNRFSRLKKTNFEQASYVNSMINPCPDAMDRSSFKALVKEQYMQEVRINGLTDTNINNAETIAMKLYINSLSAYYISTAICFDDNGNPHKLSERECIELCTEIIAGEYGVSPMVILRKTAEALNLNEHLELEIVFESAMRAYVIELCAEGFKFSPEDKRTVEELTRRKRMIEYILGME